jgi:hypothetical protein
MTEHPATARTPFWACCTGATPRDRGNLRRLLAAYVGWAVALAGGSQLIKHGVVPAGPPAWAVIGVVGLLAVLVFRSYARFLREADEMRRAIHLEGMAIAFGLAFLGASSYPLFERIGAPAADLSDAILILSLSFALGLVRATWRYR